MRTGKIQNPFPEQGCWQPRKKALEHIPFLSASSRLTAGPAHSLVAQLQCVTSFLHIMGTNHRPGLFAADTAIQYPWWVLDVCLYHIKTRLVSADCPQAFQGGCQGGSDQRKRDSLLLTFTSWEGSQDACFEVALP